MTLVIGLVGQKGSGKGTFIELLLEVAQDKTIERVGSVDILKETLDIWHIEKNRRNLQDLAIVMDGHYGKGSLSQAVKQRIEKISTDIVIFDGVRWDTDVELVKSFPHHMIVYVTADVATRYARTKQRHEKVGEDTATFDQFVEEEKILTELKIVDIGEAADVKIENNETLDHYKQSIADVYATAILSRLS